MGISVDGYIADKNNGLEWLDMVPNPEQSDMGYYAFMERIDALLMGRNTFEMVVSFDVEWPYKKPVYVLSNSMTKPPHGYEDKVIIIKGTLNEVLEKMHANGHYRIYLDGGKTVQSFLKEDLVDELILTTIPIILGGGVSLWSELPKSLELELIASEVLLGQIVQKHYARKRA